MSFIKKNKLPRLLLFTLGTISLTLGVIGIILPLLPTTPFVLLAAWCYAKSSDKFHKALLNNRFFGRIINDYQSGKGISPTMSAFTIILLWTTILFSAYIMINETIIVIILITIAIAVSIHIVSKTRKWK